MVISMLKIRRPLGRLIFNMGIAIPGKTVFLIETTPCFVLYCLVSWKDQQFHLKVHDKDIKDVIGWFERRVLIDAYMC